MGHVEDRADQLASSHDNENLEESVAAASEVAGEGDDSPVPEQRSFVSVIIHSFFIIPFLIAIFCFGLWEWQAKINMT